MLRLARRTLLLAAPAAALARHAAAAEPVVVVAIDNFAFTPQALAVPAGTVVRWVNRDDIPHQVVCPEAGLKSAVLDTDQEAEFRFEHAGRFAYFCGLHPHMTGTVTVAVA